MEHWIALLFCLLIITSLCTFFLIAVAIIGNLRKEERETALSDETLSFAVLICAKNEEQVIVNLIDSLKQQAYDKAKYAIFIIADHCQDQTAAVCRQQNVLVWERDGPGKAGKGAALAWGIGKILEQYPDQYDAVVVFDADNLADGDFLKQINQTLVSGAEVTTGNRLSVNPRESLVSRSYTVYWKMVTYLCMRPHNRLGLPCMITGTGFAFKIDILCGQGWQTQTMTEDMEFYYQQILKDRHVVLSERALFYDEQPAQIHTAFRQLHRWCSGICQIQKYYLKPLWKKWRKEPSLKVTDAIVIVLFSQSAGMGIFLNGVLAASMIMGLKEQGVYICSAVAAILYLFTVLIALSSFLCGGSPMRGNWISIFVYPFFTLLLSAIAFYSMILPAKGWKKIVHTNTRKITDITRMKGKETWKSR